MSEASERIRSLAATPAAELCYWDAELVSATPGSRPVPRWSERLIARRALNPAPSPALHWGEPSGGVRGQNAILAVNRELHRGKPGGGLVLKSRARRRRKREA